MLILNVNNNILFKTPGTMFLKCPGHSSTQFCMADSICHNHTSSRKKKGINCFTLMCLFVLLSVNNKNFYFFLQGY